MKDGEWVLLTSVWHTGTRFMIQELFSEFNFAPMQVGMPKQATYIHMEKRYRLTLQDRLYSCAYVVVPLRHPVSIYQSWKARKKPIQLLREQLGILVDMVAPMRPIYLPLDALDRDWYLAELNSRMDADFTTDWPVVKHEAEPAELTDDEMLEATMWLRYEPFRSVYDLAHS